MPIIKLKQKVFRNNYTKSDHTESVSYKTLLPKSNVAKVKCWRCKVLAEYPNANVGEKKEKTEKKETRAKKDKRAKKKNVEKKEKTEKKDKRAKKEKK